MYKNVASQKLTVIAFADAGHASLDAGEPVTGDAANITCKVEQDDDGTQTATNDVNPTEVEDGQYRFDLTQAETNGDKLTFYPQSSTAGVQVVCMPSNVIYTRPQYFGDMGINSSGHVSRVVLCDTTTTNTDMRGTDSAFLAASAPSNFSDMAITASTGKVTVGTNDDKTGYSISGTLTTLDALENISAADVNAQCDSAIETYGLDHLVSTSVTGADIADDSIIAQMVSSSGTADWDTFVNTDDSLQAISESGGGGPTAAAIADAVWDEATSGHTTAGTYGKAVGDGVTAWVTATGFSTHSAADVWTNGTRTLTGLGFTLAAGDFGASSLDGKGDWNTTTPPTASAIADQVWDEATAGHTTAGSYGKAVGDGVTDWVTATGFSTHSAADVWTSGTRTLSAFGFDVDLNADQSGVTIGTVNAMAGTITTLDALDTAQDTQHATTQSAISTAQTDLDTITGSDGVTLATTQGNYAPAKTSDVASEISDALTVDTLVDGKTIVASMQIIGAVVAGKVSGASTSTEVFVGLDGATTRATVTADTDGNRTAVVYG